MIVVIDYGMGNIASVLNMFKRIGVRDVKLSGTPGEIEKADKLLLPGVGSFDNGMKNLKASGLIPVLNKKALVEKVPVLGICLGMQLLTRRSDEGTEPGLGWIEADTKKFSFDIPDLKIPHMGWNYIRLKRPSPLLSQSEVKRKFYFVHSYYVRCDKQEDVLAVANYGMDFTCMVQKENIYGAQFHPEKSHKFGMELLENFSKIS